MVAHRQTEHERREHRLAARPPAEVHEHEQRREDELDLGLDDAVAVPAEEPRRDPGMPQIASTETPANGTIQMFGVMKSTDSPITVRMSVTKVAAMMRLPIIDR